MSSRKREVISQRSGGIRRNLKLKGGVPPAVRMERRVALETYGCTLNQADTDILQGILEEAGYVLSSDSDIPKGSRQSRSQPALRDVDIFVLNTCAVKETTENRLISRIEKLKAEGKKLVVAGCLGMGPNEKRVRKADPDAVIVLPDAISHIVEAVECAERGEAKTFSGGSEKGMLPRVYTEPILRVAVQEGCVGNCYFCQTRIARPKLVSMKPLWIKRWVEEGVRKGAKEIQVTGQDTGAYGLDIGSSLPEMLREVLAVEGDFMVRLGMINPGHAKKMLPELLEIMGNEKFYRFLHIPVQTGSEKVRKEMNRMHTVAEFEGVVEAVRRRFPDATISTDIIVGYPTESEEDFELSKELLERVQPDIVNISKYSSRRGTEASKMKKVPTQEVKRRTTELSMLVKGISTRRNKGYVGKVEGTIRGSSSTREPRTVDVLITEMQKTPTGRMRNYKQVCVDAGVGLGEWVKAEIVECNHGSLFGKLTERS